MKLVNNQGNYLNGKWTRSSLGHNSIMLVVCFVGFFLLNVGFSFIMIPKDYLSENNIEKVT